MTAELVANRPFAEIAPGDSASLTRRITQQDIELYAALTGDANPTHLATPEGESGGPRPTAHSMLGAALISTLLGTRLPGAGTVYAGQTLRFLLPLQAGDALTVRVAVRDKQEAGRLVRLDCQGTNQRGETVFEGLAEVCAPATKLFLPPRETPDLMLHRHSHYGRLIARCEGQAPVPCAVAHPCDEAALAGALEAAGQGLIRPLLVGPEARIREIAARAGLDLGDLPVIDTPHSHASAARAVALVREGKAGLLMKGSLHTDELMSAVVAREAGLRTERRISHVFIMDVPSYPEPLFITDAAINIQPDLATKADIIRNAIDLHHGLGLGTPRVAILSAVETVNPRLPGTLDAAALCKMADRGQIQGGVLDGPLALDNAISPAAARIKGIVSEVAGRAQVLVVPDLEAGNMLAKNLSFLSGADAAGIVLGARVPIVLTSRADNQRTRLASCAVAALYARHLAARLEGVA
ncbi:bifunctional enoyl-CoA hydratase/phosphate acetyltransferase [Pseudoroseomonas cervicalis]|nr:bifunctional enoyl-CoA hydratase/phosphate acetyltransferase [Pseudoroseomonas cervicalis]